MSEQDFGNQRLLTRSMTYHNRYETYFRNGAIDQVASLEDFARSYGLTVHHAERIDTCRHLPVIAGGIRNNEAITLRINLPGGGTHWVAIGRHNGLLYFFCPNNGLFNGNSQDMRFAVVTISRVVPNANENTPIDTYIWGRL